MTREEEEAVVASGVMLVQVTEENQALKARVRELEEELEEFKQEDGK